MNNSAEKANESLERDSDYFASKIRQAVAAEYDPKVNNLGERTVDLQWLTELLKAQVKPMLERISTLNAEKKQFVEFTADIEKNIGIQIGDIVSPSESFCFRYSEWKVTESFKVVGINLKGDKLDYTICGIDDGMGLTDGFGVDDLVVTVKSIPLRMAA